MGSVQLVCLDAGGSMNPGRVCRRSRRLEKHSSTCGVWFSIPRIRLLPNSDD